MGRGRPLVPEPISGLVREGDGTWRAIDNDPQFILRGPFAAGVWELEIDGGTPDSPAHSHAQIYFAASGDFSEARSVRFPPLRPAGIHRLRFLLPTRAATLRFDPTDSPGAVHLRSIVAVRRARTTAVLEGLSRLARTQPRAVTRLARDLVRSVPDPRAARRLLLDVALAREPDPYEAWLRSRLRQRQASYPFRQEGGLLSILTTVYDTAPEFLDALASGMRAQSFAAYEWLVLDNGSRSRATKRALARIARDPRVRLFDTPDNLGIVGGMRFVLERARGRYILPVDSDDELTPDALAIVASTVQRGGYPSLLYSDEDKLRGGRRLDPFFKPDWDPVLFRNCCYIAHLCALDREQALALGVYTDRGCEGCHDWDTFFRFTRAGHAPVHIPEIIYSWRMHAQSTAADAAAKDYIISSHRHVLSRHLELTGTADRLDVVRSPLFPASPDWWIRRRRVAPPRAALIVCAGLSDQRHIERVLRSTGDYPLHAVQVVRSGVSAAATLFEAAQQDVQFVAIADARTAPASDEWLWEIAGIFDAFPDTGLVGGRTVDANGRVVSAADVVDRDGHVDSPDRGRHCSDPGDFGLALKQRSVVGVSAALCGVSRELLRSLTGEMLPEDPTALGAALSGAAHAARLRVVYSPFVEARMAGQEDFELVQDPPARG